MRTVFREHDLLDIVEGKIKRVELSVAEKIEEFDNKQVKTMRMIGTTVPARILNQLEDLTTGSEMWDALWEGYEGFKKESVMNR